ncbi:MAG TPA: pyridoxamine 5'-phosphate oxidase family protein [Solirubrobacterales bacterium]|nr:pyridoxamine 5'-phosphate oxidase family protein [Solirubrobacterales bacterium]
MRDNGAETARPRRGVELDEEELWEFLAGAHTGVLTTLRRDGRPVSLPTWFVVRERQIYVRTPRSAAKVRRIEADPRASFLAETGLAWAELRAAELDVRASILPPGEEAAALAAALDEKYRDFRPDSEAVPAATNRHYQDRLIIRLEPQGDPVSWDNRKIRPNRGRR